MSLPTRLLTLGVWWQLSSCTRTSWTLSEWSFAILDSCSGRRRCCSLHRVFRRILRLLTGRKGTLSPWLQHRCVCSLLLVHVGVVVLLLLSVSCLMPPLMLVHNIGAPCRSTRHLTLRFGDLLETPKIKQADIIIIQTDLPSVVHRPLVQLLNAQSIKTGCRMLSYLNLHDVWASIGAPFPFVQHRINRSPHDRCVNTPASAAPRYFPHRTATGSSQAGATSTDTTFTCGSTRRSVCLRLSRSRRKWMPHKCRAPLLLQEKRRHCLRRSPTSRPWLAVSPKTMAICRTLSLVNRPCRFVFNGCTALLFRVTFSRRVCVCCPCLVRVHVPVGVYRGAATRRH